jgi:predicted ATPase/DNA-binding CsgD family transcriptional regulator
VTRGSRLRRGKGRLPAETTAFIDRGADVAGVKRLLSAARLVTLTGVGGAGKTRLAVRVATDVRDAYPDGAWLVDLTGITNPAWLERAVAGALNVADRTDQRPSQVVIEYLRDRHLLLVLDNCEHLLDACACFVDRILRHAPGVRLVCTSRQSLGLVAEHVWEVAPLSLPTADRPVPAGSGPQYAALALFAARAAAVVSGFVLTAENLDTVADVCQRLDGLPLAIELAAVQLRTRTLTQLAAGLTDRFRLLATRYANPPHHRTLASTFEWSYALCSPQEQALWARLSTFHDSFPADAAAAVCMPELPAAAVVDLLSGLLDKSVLVRSDGSAGIRYRLLETVRQYGRDRLRADHDPTPAELARRHRDWYLGLTRRFDADWFGPRQAQWLDELHRELANIRAALDLSLSTPGDAAAGLEMASRLVHFWYPSGLLHEGRYWLQRALNAAPAPTRIRGYALIASANLAQIRGELATAIAQSGEAARIGRALSDARLCALAERGAGMVATMGGNDPAAGCARLRKALTELQKLSEDGVLVAETQLALALALLFCGELDEAAELGTRCRELCEAHSDRWWLGHAYSAAAHIALAAGDLDAANGHTRRVLELRAELDDVVLLAVQIERFGWLAGEAGDHRRAARLLGAADGMWRRLGGRMFGADLWLRAHTSCVEAARRALGRAGYEAEFQRGAALTPQEAARYALGRKPIDEPDRKDQLLTPRERQVADLIAEGLSNRQVAARLGTSQRTAESHVENILRKLGFAARAQVAAWVVQQAADGVRTSREAAGQPRPPSR